MILQPRALIATSRARVNGSAAALVFALQMSELRPRKSFTQIGCAEPPGIVCCAPHSVQISIEAEAVLHASNI
jgi:hypothetical protein